MSPLGQPSMVAGGLFLAGSSSGHLPLFILNLNMVSSNFDLLDLGPFC